MTPEDVMAKVRQIEEMQRDDEAAHGLEDDLYRAVLAAIALGAPNARELADAALHTQRLSFARWCA